MTSRLEILPFDGKNDFGSWKKKMRALLSYNKVLIALESDEVKWTEEQKSRKGEINEGAYNLIVLSLSDTVLRKVDGQETPLAIWECMNVEAQSCKQSGNVRGRKSPPGQRNRENDFDCCAQGKLYSVYKCSPPMSTHTKALLTINSSEKGGDGGEPSECCSQYHSDDTPVVALSTGWFNNEGRCLKNITISGNGHSVVAMVVDECDSTMGCDSDHDYQPPCPNNIVDASRAVWEVLGVPRSDWGGLDIVWSDV